MEAIKSEEPNKKEPGLKRRPPIGGVPGDESNTLATVAKDETEPLPPNRCKTLEDIPAWLREGYERGEVDIDEPPGISDMYYKKWVELGGKVLTSGSPARQVKREPVSEVALINRWDKTLSAMSPGAAVRILEYLLDKHAERQE